MTAATTRPEHVRHSTNAALAEYSYDLECITSAYLHQLCNGDPTAASGVLMLFRLATERVAEELARLERFGGAS